MDNVYCSECGKIIENAESTSENQYCNKCWQQINNQIDKEIGCTNE
jgi:DNA-directed RNA polymerase subunit RPC12/RpoP